MKCQPFLFRGRWLVATRVLWLAIVAVYVIVSAVGIREVVRQYQNVSGMALVAGFSHWTQQGLLDALHANGLSISHWTVYNLTASAAVVLIFLSVGGLLFVRRSGDWFAWFASLFLITFGLEQSGGIPALNAVNPAGYLTAMLALPWLGFYVFFFAFPDGRFIPRWTAVWTVMLAVMFLSPLAGNPAYVGIVVLAFLSGVFAQVYRYWRVSDATQRNQARWVLYTITFVALGEIIGQGIIPVILPAVTVDGTPKLIYSLLLNGLLFPLFGLLPVSIAIAVLRYRLWSIDVIVRRTIIYGILTATLLALYISGVVVLQRLFVALTGQRSELAIVASTLAIVALFVPLRNGIQAVIDRRFYRRKYDAEKALETFALTARDEVDQRRLAAGLMDAIEETVQPEQMTLWVREGAQRPVVGGGSK